MVEQGAHWQNFTAGFKSFVYLYYLGGINKQTYLDLLCGDFGNSSITITILGLFLIILGTGMQFFS